MTRTECFFVETGGIDKEWAIKIMKHIAKKYGCHVEIKDLDGEIVDEMY